MAASDASVGRSLPWMAPGLDLATAPKVGEQHIGDRAVHRLGHDHRQQQTRGADHHAGDHQRRVLQHEPFQPHGKAGEGVVD